MRRVLGLARGGALTMLVLVTACGDTLDTDLLSLDDPNCAGTRVDRACLSLVFKVARGTREDADGDLAGRLEWGVYKDGDVSWNGPDDRQAKLFGTPEPPPNPESLPWVDFNATSEFVITLPDIKARDYQAVAYLDDDGSGEADAGDPVNMPGDSFKVKKDTHTSVTVSLNYIMF